MGSGWTFFLSVTVVSPFDVGDFLVAAADVGILASEVGAGDEDFSSGEVVLGMLTLILALPG